MTKAVSDSPTPDGDAEQRVVYLLQQDGAVSAASDVTLLDLWLILWNGKWFGGAIATVVVLATVVYALLATEWYRVEVLLAPAEERSVQNASGALSGLSGLASLAGITTVGGGNAEALAVLNSRAFLREFIEDRDLMPVLYEDLWDAERGVWLVDDEEDIPDIRYAVQRMRSTVMEVIEEPRSGLVTLAVEWTDPEIAADWAEDLVRRLNATMRERALAEASRNVAYLQAQLASTSLVTLQQTVGRLLESELQKLMLAEGNDEFAFRVIDPAEVPPNRARPQRTLLVLLAAIAGSLLGTIAIFVRHALRRAPDRGGVV